MKHWTPEETQILEDKYPLQGSDIPELDRTRLSIYSKSKRERVRYIYLTPICANKDCETPWMPHGGRGLCTCCYQKDYYSRNRERLIEYSKQWKRDNPERSQEYQREYNKLRRTDEAE